MREIERIETEMKKSAKTGARVGHVKQDESELRDETVHYTEEELVLYNRLCCHIFCLKDGLVLYQGRKENLPMRTLKA